jgi:hypothetical protein
VGRETRYRLFFNVPGDRDGDTPPNRDFQTLAGALAAAWANNTSGGHSLSITYSGLPLMGEEDLIWAIERLRAIECECPADGKIGCAVQVISEMGLS